VLDHYACYTNVHHIVFDVIVVQAEDGIRDRNVTGVQTCALPISGLVTISPRVPTRPTRRLDGTRPRGEMVTSPATDARPRRTRPDRKSVVEGTAGQHGTRQEWRGKRLMIKSVASQDHMRDTAHRG